MRTIKASCGREIVVDAEDYAFLSRFKWYIQLNRDRGGYARTNMYIGEKKFQIAMHRLITGMKKRTVDHANGNTLDNRKSNLRFSTDWQNQANSSARFNKLGYKGVFRPAKFKRFFARIRAKNKIYRSPLVDTLEEAAREYDKLALKHHGEFASLNFPKSALLGKGAGRE